MYHIATHNIGLGSYNDDFNRLMKDLLMKDHFVKGFYCCYSFISLTSDWNNEIRERTTSKFIEED